MQLPGPAPDLYFPGVHGWQGGLSVPVKLPYQPGAHKQAVGIVDPAVGVVV